LTLKAWIKKIITDSYEYKRLFLVNVLITPSVAAFQTSTE